MTNSMTQVDQVAKFLMEWSSNKDIHIFGQNITRPSYISGIGKFLASDPKFVDGDSNFFDSTNSELSSVGYGIGRSIGGKDSLLVVKQQDFLYLAIDQFVNTLCNLPSDINDYGEFSVLCLISDFPYEGTQAWSNNLSLFESLPPSLHIAYCYNCDMLKAELDSTDSNYRLIFLSVNYMYKSSRFNSLSRVDDDLPVWYSGLLGSKKTYIFIGFVDENFVSSIDANSTIIILQRNTFNLFESWLISYLEQFCVQEIVIIESSTSSLSVGDSLAFRISKLSDVSITTLNTRKINTDGFYLACQSKSCEHLFL